MGEHSIEVDIGRFGKRETKTHSSVSPCFEETELARGRCRKKKVEPAGLYICRTAEKYESCGFLSRAFSQGKLSSLLVTMDRGYRYSNPIELVK